MADWIPKLPDIFRCAHEGDKVARALIERQGEEIVIMARSLIRRANLADAPLTLVLGGGVIKARDPLLMAAIEKSLKSQELKVRVTIPNVGPIIGSGLLVLESMGAESAILTRFAEMAENYERIDPDFGLNMT